MKIKKMHWYGIIAFILIIVISIVFFRENISALLFLIGIAIGLLVLPFVISLSLENKREQKINEMFLEFSRNLAESVSAGIPINKAISNMTRKDYGALNEHIKKLSNQIELGIPIERALKTLANDSESTLIKRAVSLISEAERAGGEIENILNSTAKSISEIEKLKKERKSAIYSLIVQGYIIFFIFSGISLVMEFKIFPLVSDMGGADFLYQGDINIKNPGNLNQPNIKKLTQPFLFLLLTQGFFIGLVIGKLAEGSIKKGIKHSFILMLFAYLTSTGSKLFFSTGAAQA